MTKELFARQGNDSVEEADRYTFDFKITKDPDRKRWHVLEAQIVLEDGSVEDYIDSGRDETKLMHRFQEVLATLGSRKNDTEGFNYEHAVPAGEMRDTITPHDFNEYR